MKKGMLLLIFSAILAGCWPSEKEATLHYTQAQKEWGVAASALLTWDNRSDFFSLPGRCDSPQAIQIVKRRILEDDWGIHSREELLQALERVWNRGHRGSMQEIRDQLERGWSPFFIVTYARLRKHHCSFKRIEWVREHADELDENSMVGWDLARVVSLTRWGVHVGYLSEEEAWTWIMPAAQKIQVALGSWQELGADYLVGRSFWSPRTMKRNGDRMRQGIYWLTHAPGSPWVENDWNLNLTGRSEALADGEEKLPPTASYFEGIEWTRTKKYKQAIQSFEQSIQTDRALYQGMAHAKLASIYRYGRKGIPKDLERANSYFRQGVALENEACLSEMGLKAYRKKEYDKALRFWEAGAKRGSLYSLGNLGLLYDSGKGVEKDLERAVEYHEKTACSGMAFAKNNLAWLMYKNPDYWDADRAVSLAYAAVQGKKVKPNVNTLIKVLVKAERYPEALKAWEILAQFYKQDDNNWDNLSLSEHVRKERQRILEKMK